MGKPFVSTTIRLDPAEAERLKALSAATQIPQSALIREAIGMILAEREAAVTPCPA